MWYNILAGGVYAETLQAENIILSAYPIHILRHQYMGGIFTTKKEENMAKPRMIGMIKKPIKNTDRKQNPFGKKKKSK